MQQGCPMPGPSVEPDGKEAGGAVAPPVYMSAPRTLVCVDAIEVHQLGSNVLDIEPGSESRGQSLAQPIGGASVLEQACHLTAFVRLSKRVAMAELNQLFHLMNWEQQDYLPFTCPYSYPALARSDRCIGVSSGPMLCPP